MKIIKYVLVSFIVVVLIIVSYIVIKGNTMYQQAIKDKSIEKVVNELRESSDYTRLNEIPKTYRDAVIAVEDHRFYNHGGVDPISIGRAIIVDIKEMSLVEGGSTLTQQLCKNLYFTQEKRFDRKIAEMFMAWDFEKKYNKDEILELYINNSYFGSGYYGIKQASNGYFNKEPKDLNEYECTILAGIPNAPSVYSLDNDNGLARERQKQVIDCMVEFNYISENEANLIYNY